MKKKQIRAIAIAAIALVFLGLGIAQLKIEPAENSVPSTSPGTLSDKPDDKQPELFDDAQQPDDVDQPAEAESSDKVEQSAGVKQPEQAEQPAVIEEPDPVEQPEQIEQPPVVEEPKQPEQPAETESPALPPEPPEESVIHTCTLEIRCDTVVDTSKLENEAVIPYVPANGVILATTEVEYTPGENVFEVLKRVTRDQGIQMEFRDDPLYSGAYIEGINYLYEFDGGTLSGWMYKVNGQFPNYGCSQYFVEDGDEIVWMYTCDLGRDVGDNSTW